VPGRAQVRVQLFRDPDPPSPPSHSSPFSPGRTVSRRPGYGGPPRGNPIGFRREKTR
jgi:hypothetical protein